MNKPPTESPIQKETVSNELAANQAPGGPPDLSRRQMGVGLLALLAGGLGLVKRALAFESGADGNFNAASHILRRYGVIVNGASSSGRDLLNVETVPLPNTDYSQSVGMRSRIGEINPCYKTLVLTDDAGEVGAIEATHFHDGAIIPCVKTTIEGHSLATHELFDSDRGGIQPCYKVESQMLPGGHIGDIVATHFHDGAINPCWRSSIVDHSRAITELFDASEGDITPCFKVVSEMLPGGRLGAVEVTIEPDLADLIVRVGSNSYTLVGGALVPRIT